MKRRHLASEHEAIAFGREVASSLRPGAVVALTGGLGAGKTHVAKGVAAGLGFQGVVTSPTFALVHEYQEPGQKLPLWHFDFYRLNSADEVLALGWDEYLESGGVCLVEWADLFPALLPTGTAWWQLTTAIQGGRWIEPVNPPTQPSIPLAPPTIPHR